MKTSLASAATALLLLGSQAQALTFDAAYTVGTSGSTVAVADFAIDGPVPWLFVDLPALGSFSTFVSAKWFLDGVPSAQFEVFPSTADGQRFWLSPAESVWNGKKAVGPWHVDATFSLTGILFAENGGIGVGISEGSGSTTVTFRVTPAAVPLPAAGPLFALAVGGLGLRVRRGPHKS